MGETRTLTYETYLVGEANVGNNADATDNAQDTAELPLIVALHFMDSTPNQTFDILLSNLDCPARVIAPYGQYQHEDGYAWFPDELYQEHEREQGRFIESVAGILLDNVALWIQEFPTPDQPIYLGMSQGGDLCFSLAAQHGDQFRLCLPIAGRLLTDDIVRHRQSGIVRIHHGKQDPIVPVDQVRQAAERLLSVRLDVEIREYDGVGHAVPLEMLTVIHRDIYAVIGR